MGEFMHRDGWDLDAVVRGHMSQAATSAGSCDMVEWFDSFLGDYGDPLMMTSSSNTGSGWDRHRFSLDDFPAGFSETTMSMVLDDDPTEMLPASVVGSTCNKNVEAGGKLQQSACTSVLDPSAGVEEAVHVVAKYKRRKNQQKQVVQQVTADGTSSDLWAWRKYGQKPIKGSPYPRSYYRCSSSKGCVARKQVERSSLEPGMFIVTYSGEHSHTQPTRRSALAGITRPSKFATPKRSSSSANATKYQVQVQQSISKSPQETSPVNNIYEGSSPISASTVDDGPSKLETLAWTESGNLDEIAYPPSLVLGEEMFLGFDELEGLGMDFALTGC